MDELDRIEEHRDLTAGLEYESQASVPEFTFVEKGLSLEQIASAVDGYTVIRHRGDCFVQPRGAEEKERLHELGALIKEVWVDGQHVCEAHLHRMLPKPTVYDEEGSLVDNRREIVLSFFRERDGYSTYPGVSS